MKRKILLVIGILIVAIIIGIVTGTGKISEIFNKNKNNTENKIENMQEDNIIVTPKVNGVEKIKVEEKSNTEEAKHYKVFEGLDKENNIIWTYKTSEVYVAQYENLEYFGENNGKVYINEEGTIITIDKNTGKVLWKNDEYKASGSVHTFDKDGILYLAAPTSPSLFAVDSNGKTFERINTIDPEYLYWPSQIKITDNNELTIYYPQEFDGVEYNDKIIFSLEEMKNKENRILEKEIEAKYSDEIVYGFENFEKFTLNKNGEVILTYKGNNKTTKIEDNVKSIKFLFEGNGGFGSLVMLKKDGSVSALRSEDIYNSSNSNITIKQLDISNVKYTIVHEAFEGEGYFVVTNDGKVVSGFDLNEK